MWPITVIPFGPHFAPNNCASVGPPSQTHPRAPVEGLLRLLQPRRAQTVRQGVVLRVASEGKVLRPGLVQLPGLAPPVPVRQLLQNVVERAAGADHGRIPAAAGAEEGYHGGAGALEEGLFRELARVAVAGPEALVEGSGGARLADGSFTAEYLVPQLFKPSVHKTRRIPQRALFNASCK